MKLPRLWLRRPDSSYFHAVVGRYSVEASMTPLWIGFGTISLLALGVRVGWSFGFRDGFEKGRKERRDV